MRLIRRAHCRVPLPGQRATNVTQLDKMIAWEEGELADDEVIALFQDLINSGQAWTLQGCYGRQAQALIDAGLCTNRAAKQAEAVR